jgi:hypothetical protein
LVSLLSSFAYSLLSLSFPLFVQAFQRITARPTLFLLQLHLPPLLLLHQQKAKQMTNLNLRQLRRSTKNSAETFERSRRDLPTAN